MVDLSAFALGTIVINYSCFFGTICGSYRNIFFLVFSAKFAAIDIAFALSATGMSANTTFKLMKDTIDLIAEKYGTGSMRYSFILYSDTANIEVKFSEKYSSLEDLRAAIEALLPVTGGSNLPAALTAAKEAFEDSGVRENAAHVLVVISDKRSGASEENVKNAGKPLEDSGIVVVPVAIGNEVDKIELEWATSDEDNVIDVKADEEPEILMEMILAKINGTLSLSSQAVMILGAKVSSPVLRSNFE